VLKDKFDLESYFIASKVHFLLRIRKITKDKKYIFFLHPSYKIAPLLFLVRALAQKTIVVDAFVSLYDMRVNDNKIVSKKSLRSFYYYLLDFLFFKFSDIIIFDTEENKNFFSRIFKISNKKKKVVIPVIVDLDFIASVLTKKHDSLLDKNYFNVFFYGNYISLQGVEYIIRAAKILEKEKNIKFHILGPKDKGAKYVELAEQLNVKNINFLDAVEYEDLIRYMGEADVCLGIFGDTDKAKRVIPNKVLEAMACGKIVITGRNKEMERVFENKKDIIFCEMANEKDLAEKIMSLYENKEKFDKMGVNAKNKVKEYFSRRRLKEIISRKFIF
jgi:glycosyltransferase involved in cell wall biosynthesis